MEANLAGEIRRRYASLGRIAFDDASTRLGALWKWMAAQRPVRLVLEDLRATVDEEGLLATHGMHTPPKAGTEEEIALVGVHLLETSAAGQALWASAMDLGIYPSHRSSDHQDNTDAAIKRYIEPAISFIANRLAGHKAAPTPDQLFTSRLGRVVSPAFRASFPRTVSKLEEVAAQIGLQGSSTANIANSCRAALLDFARELPDTSFKKGDVKNTIKALVGKADASVETRERLTGLMNAVWDYTQNMVHRPHATEAEAERAFTWTCLAVIEVADLLRLESD